MTCHNFLCRSYELEEKRILKVIRIRKSKTSILTQLHQCKDFLIFTFNFIFTKDIILKSERIKESKYTFFAKM